MPEMPDLLSNHPADSASYVDVIAEVLEAVHLSTAVFGRMELGAPWRIRVPARDYLTFYVVARGTAWMEVEERTIARRDSEARLSTIALSAGDAVVLPKVTAHSIRDSAESKAPPQDFDYEGC